MTAVTDILPPPAPAVPSSEQNLRFILGLKLNHLRKQRGLSLKQVASRADVAVSYLNEIEKGKKYPKPEKILALSRALGTTYDELVSARLNEKLNPLSGVLKSGVLDEIPLEVFGLTPTGLLEMMAASPDKISALFDTFVKIARRFDVTMEHLLLAAMRSYVEQNKNHFEELELAAENFRITHPWAQTPAPDLARLREYLASVRGYTIDESGDALPAELGELRAITTGGDTTTPRLRLNPRLGAWQKAFLLAREIGYRELGFKEPLTTSPILRVDSFEQLLNNFRASYFAGALLLSRPALVADMRRLFSQPAWSGEILLEIKRRYQATPEMFFHRLSQIVPHQLGLEQMYFVRFDHRRGTPDVRIGKELHYQRMHGTHSIGVNEHYCRRWISHRLLTQLEANLATNPDSILAGAQRSRFHGPGDEYFSIALAYPHGLEPGLNSCVMLGFHVDETLKSVVRFWNDPALPVQVVGDTCERCGVPDCADRVVAASLRDREQRRLRQFEALDTLKPDLRPSLAGQRG
jgi:XRE family transcriptional regulator, fatty acid utilization regulator